MVYDFRKLFAGYVASLIKDDDAKKVPIIGGALSTAANVSSCHLYLGSGPNKLDADGGIAVYVFASFL